MSIAAVIYVALTGVISLFVPWLGIIFYYLFSVGQMQSMWPHHFGLESRVAMLLTVTTFLGLCGATAIKAVNYRVLLYPHTIAILLLMAWLNLSVTYTSYIVHVDRLPGILSTAEIVETFNKIIVLYIFGALLIDTRKKLLWLVYAFALITVYYAFWANMMYFTGQFWLFGYNGRLGGMPNSVYLDENYLAMLFVFATPLLYYIGISFTKFHWRYGIWMIIPMTWHALFLTGSRGGLLSLGFVIIYMFFRSYHRLASIGIVIGLVVAVIYQSGVLLNRVDSTIEKAEGEQEILSDEEALDPRLLSWMVGLKIIRDYPGFGVGVGNFSSAFPDYSNTQRHVAHNTFIQFSAECGIITGLIYLWWFYMRFKTFFRKSPPGTVFPAGLHRDYLDDMLNALFIGLFMAAIFLDLMIYEILYMMFLLSFSKYAIERKVPVKYRKPKDTIYRTGQRDAPAPEEQGARQPG